MSVNPNQWQDIGNCNVCRRVKYCRTPCKRHKRLMAEMMRKIHLANKLEAMNRDKEKTDG